MRYELTVGDLVEQVQQNLDLDPRYFDQQEGVLDWAGDKVLFVKLPDEIELTYRGETFTCLRL